MRNTFVCQPHWPQLKVFLAGGLLMRLHAANLSDKTLYNLSFCTCNNRQENWTVEHFDIGYTMLYTMHTLFALCRIHVLTFVSSFFVLVSNFWSWTWSWGFFDRAARNIARRLLSQRLSVRHTPVLCLYTAKPILKLFGPSDSSIIPVFFLTSAPISNSKGNPVSRRRSTRRVGKFLTEIAFYLGNGMG